MPPRGRNRRGPVPGQGRTRPGTQRKVSHMPEGIDVRVGKDGRKSYRVRVWSQRDRKRIVKSFRSAASAKAWRADALVALRQGTLRTPDPRTVREAAAAWLDGARDGTVRDRSGRGYKPSTIRTYGEKLNGYV